MEIFFNSLTSVTAEFTTSNFIFIISYLCKNSSPIHFVRSSNCTENFQQEKKVFINHRNLMNEQKQPFTKILF